MARPRSLGRLSDEDLASRLEESTAIIRKIQDDHALGVLDRSDRPARLREAQAAAKSAETIRSEQERRARARPDQQAFLEATEREERTKEQQRFASIAKSQARDEPIDSEIARLEAVIDREEKSGIEGPKLASFRDRLSALLRSKSQAQQAEQARLAREADLERKRAEERERARAKAAAAGKLKKPFTPWQGADPATLAVLASATLGHFIRGSLPPGTAFVDADGREHEAAEVEQYLAGGGRLPMIEMHQVGVLAWGLHLVAERGNPITFNPKERALRPADCPTLQQDLARLDQLGLLSFRAERSTIWHLGLGERSLALAEQFRSGWKAA